MVKTAGGDQNTLIEQIEEISGDHIFLEEMGFGSEVLMVDS